ncbi:MAG: DUF2490 domain-containing protein [Balneolaceae bacterium]|nr:DUF2490 domain-containing protein [Balneolaceae bacterium]MBO6547902.1 DUF2490 domain-containing protein [Balneolaceae bacterium]MBO6648415.1 DUF2490 domain-containing protein [Balneolaceae bacterium]
MKNTLIWGTLFFVVFLTSDIKSQNAEYIWAPALTYSWDHTDLISFSAKTEIFTSLDNLDNANIIRHAEASLFGAYKLKKGNKFGMGYLYRQSGPFTDNPRHENRITEQLDLKSPVFGRSGSHRIRLEQRIRTQGFANRARYRLSIKFPHKKEDGNYFKISDEILLSLSEGETSGENRALVGYGFGLNDDSDLEFAVQYRAADFFEGNGLSHLILFSTSLSL